jgi:RNA polymerase sigma-70 factor (ECF subfamily)
MKKHIEACPACVAFIRDLNSAIERCRAFQTDCDSGIPARLTALVAREYLRLIGQPA